MYQIYGMTCGIITIYTCKNIYQMINSRYIELYIHKKNER